MRHTNCMPELGYHDFIQKLNVVCFSFDWVISYASSLMQTGAAALFLWAVIRDVYAHLAQQAHQDVILGDAQISESLQRHLEARGLPRWVTLLMIRISRLNFLCFVVKRVAWWPELRSLHSSPTGWKNVGCAPEALWGMGSSSGHVWHVDGTLGPASAEEKVAEGVVFYSSKLSRALNHRLPAAVYAGPLLEVTAPAVVVVMKYLVSELLSL